MKSNNKGFSLIELIICITILALFSTLVVVGLGYMDLANSKKCVSKIDSGLMTLKSRNMADSKRTYLHIYRYTDGNYYLTYTCLLYTSPSPRDRTRSRMPSSA